MKIWSGLVLSIVIAIVSQPFGGGPLALLIGILVGNSLTRRRQFEEGATFAEATLLPLAIACLGGTISAPTLWQIGWNGFGFIVMQISATIALALLIGRALGYTRHFRFLMASGNAICGSAAIAATSPVIGANDEEKALAVTLANVIGTVLLFVLPAVHGTNTAALLGGVLQSVGQVVASGKFVAPHTAELALVFKMVRVLMLVVVVSAFSYAMHRTVRAMSLPWYIVGFLSLCVLYSIGIITPPIAQLLHIGSSYLEVIALAAIGLRINIRHLLKQGGRAALYALIVGVGQVGLALFFIQLFL